jgi:putative transposase
MRRIDGLRLEHPFMGARMLRELTRRGIHAGRGHIQPLMLRIGIAALTVQPSTRNAAPGDKVYA